MKVVYGVVNSFDGFLGWLYTTKEQAEKKAKALSDEWNTAFEHFWVDEYEVYEEEDE